MFGAVLLIAGMLSGCSSQDSSEPNSDITTSGDQFESDNPEDSTFTDDAGNEMQVGENLELPADWPAAVPTPEGRLIAVSIIDESTAVATWQVDGDVVTAENALVEAFTLNGFRAERSEDLSTDSITVYTAVGNDLDVTVSATPGAGESDPGEITLLVNPSF